MLKGHSVYCVPWHHSLIKGVKISTWSASLVLNVKDNTRLFIRPPSFKTFIHGPCT